MELLLDHGGNILLLWSGILLLLLFVVSVDD